MSQQKLIDDFKIFRNHCIIIRRDYNTYNELFFSGSEELLNKTAPTFFTDISEIMLRDWILQVCKLMDPESTVRKGATLENITIKLIDSQLKDCGLATLSIENLSSALLKYGEKLIPARNKRIAHFDRDHQLSPIILGETTETDLTDFLNNIQEYCDEVGRAIGIGPLDFSSSGCKGDVIDFLSALKKAGKTNSMLKTTYKHLNTVQKGSFGEAFAKMAFTLEGLEVYTTEYDDRGVDFVIRNKSGKFFSVQVKTTDASSNPFIKSEKFQVSDDFIFCAVRIVEGKLPIIYIAKGSDWEAENECLHYNPDGGSSGAYYEIRFANKYEDQLKKMEFINYIRCIR